MASPLFAVMFYLSFLFVGADPAEPSALSTVLIFYLIFTGLFDAPHIFSTFSRTYKDPVERSRNPWLHWMVLAIAVSLSVGTSQLGRSDVFLTLLNFYGAWHIVKQNIGFIRMYQRLNPALQTAHSRYEIHIVIAGLFFFYLFGHSDVEEFFREVWWTSTLLLALRIFICLSLFYYSFHIAIDNYRVWKSTGSVNLPKLGMIFSSLFLVFWLAALKVNPLMLIALSTIGHDLQYQAWMWFYNKKRFSISWARVALLLSLMVGAVIALGPEPVTPIYNGVVLWHYFIDGIIWKFSSSPELLGLLSDEMPT